nr:MAG TPA: hypothetical protein [Bacteriophage sp.]
MYSLLSFFYNKKEAVVSASNVYYYRHNCGLCLFLFTLMMKAIFHYLISVYL